MTEEEAGRHLRMLEAGLVEVGAVDLAERSRRAAREDGDDFEGRAMLTLLLDEIEAVIVDAPRMLRVTLHELGAERLTFATDPSDVRFTERGYALSRRTVGEDAIDVTMDTLQPLLGNAEEAAGLIGELRGRI